MQNMKYFKIFKKLFQRLYKKSKQLKIFSFNASETEEKKRLKNTQRRINK